MNSKYRNKEIDKTWTNSKIIFNSSYEMMPDWLKQLN